MFSLRIPLDKGQTPRRRRRGVWPIAAYLIGFLLVLAVVRVISLRTSLAAAAPEGTDLALVFVGQEAKKTILKKFGDQPIIPATPLSLSDLSEFLGRELGIFIDFESSAVSLAFQGKISEEFTQEINGYGISIQKEGGIIFLKNEKDDLMFRLPSSSFHFSSIFPGFSGSVILKNELGSLFLSERTMKIKVKTGFGQSSGHRFLPENTIIYAPIQQLTSIFGSILALGPELDGEILFTFDESGFGYRIETGPVDKEILLKILEKISLESTLTTEKVILDDETVVSEMRYEPETLVFSENMTDDGSFLINVSVVGKEEGSVSALLNDQKVILSNKTPLLADASENDNFTPICFSDRYSAIFRPRTLAGFSVLENDRFTVPFPFLSPSFFKEIGFFPNKIVICW